MNKIKYALLGMAAAVFAGCADLSYNEASSRDEDWTYNSPLNGVKALVYDVYAQMPSEFKDYFYDGAMIASATDEAEYALAYSSIHKLLQRWLDAFQPLPRKLGQGLPAPSPRCTCTWSASTR